jgi:hypothetical protein
MTRPSDNELQQAAKYGATKLSLDNVIAMAKELLELRGKLEVLRVKAQEAADDRWGSGMLWATAVLDILDNGD